MPSGKSLHEWVFRAWITVRLVCAAMINIHDCDEIFNYWEPLHFLLYGWGMQTWEHSPKYAIRSYVYLGIHWIIALLVKTLAHFFVSPPVVKLVVFFGLRAVLAIICTWTEYDLFMAIHEHYGLQTSLWWCFFMALSPGMSHASVSFLPNSFGMYLVMIFMAAYLRGNIRKAVCVLTIAIFLTQPFVAILGIPFLMDVFLSGWSSNPLPSISKQRIGKWTSSIPYFLYPLVNLASTGLLSILMVGIPISLLESFVYNRLTFPWLNLVLYNVLPWDGSNLITTPTSYVITRKSQLFGVEPWTFYVKNLLVNFNVAFLFALLSVPLVVIRRVWTWPKDPFEETSRPQVPQNSSSTLYTSLPFRKWLPLSIFYLWFVLFSLEPHKEERFMYVIYPALCLNGSVSVLQFFHLANSIMLSLCRFPWMKNIQFLYLVMVKTLRMAKGLFMIGFIVLSLARIFALYHFYHGPVNVFTYAFTSIWPQEMKNTVRFSNETEAKLYEKGFLPPQTIINICVGEEWHRFPSHFFFPSNMFKLGFLRLSNPVLLPQYYSSPGFKGIRAIPPHLNDEYRADPAQFVTDPDRMCAYIIDSMGNPLSLESERTSPSAHVDNLYHPITPHPEQWKPIYCKRFIDAPRSPLLFRTLYIPGVSPKRVHWIHYCIFRNTHFTREDN